MSAVVAFIDIREVGHTSSAMVERVYGHLNDQSLAGAVNALPSVENLRPYPDRCVFRPMPITDSGACRSPIPVHADHDSGACRSRFRSDRSDRNSAVAVTG